MATETSELSIRTPDGTAKAWLHRASGTAGAAAQPGIVFYPDAFGVRPALQEMASHLAEMGYRVLLPNVFYRAGEFAPFDPATAFSDPPERERLMKIVKQVTPEALARDSAAYLDALAGEKGVRADRLGATGYCMGGRLAFLTAAFHPDRVQAAMGFHPGGMVGDDEKSPHRLAGKVKAALYFGVADNDRGFTPEQQATLAQALGAAHLNYVLELYQDQAHGYAVPGHAVFNPEAQARHWRRTESFFGEYLQR